MTPEQYTKQEQKRKSQIVSHLLNTNYYLKLSDYDFTFKLKQITKNLITSKTFILMGKEQLVSGKYGASFKNKRVATNYMQVQNLIQKEVILPKCFDLDTKETHIVFLRQEPDKIYDELFKRGYFTNEEYEETKRELFDLGLEDETANNS